MGVGDERYIKEKRRKQSTLSLFQRAKKYFQEYTLEFSLYKIVKGYSEPLFANNTESDIQEEVRILLVSRLTTIKTKTVPCLVQI